MDPIESVVNGTVLEPVYGVFGIAKDSYDRLGDTNSMLSFIMSSEDTSSAAGSMDATLLDPTVLHNPNGTGWDIDVPNGTGEENYQHAENTVHDQDRAARQTIFDFAKESFESLYTNPTDGAE